MSSKTFDLGFREEKRIDLKIKKETQCKNTCLTGSVFYDCCEVSGATVMITDLNFNILCHIKTNRYGVYVFKNVLPIGAYFVKAVYNKYKSSEDKLIFLEYNELTKENFYLDEYKSIKPALGYGIVKDSITHKRLNSVLIRLKKWTSNKLCFSTYSNDSGQYLLIKIRSGCYYIEAYHEDYLVFCSHKVNVLQGDEFKLNIYLTNLNLL